MYSINLRDGSLKTTSQNTLHALTKKSKQPQNKKEIDRIVHSHQVSLQERASSNNKVTHSRPTPGTLHDAKSTQEEFFHNSTMEKMKVMGLHCQEELETTYKVLRSPLYTQVADFQKYLHEKEGWIHYLRTLSSDLPTKPFHHGSKKYQTTFKHEKERGYTQYSIPRTASFIDSIPKLSPEKEVLDDYIRREVKRKFQEVIARLNDSFQFHMELPQTLMGTNLIRTTTSCPVRCIDEEEAELGKSLEFLGSIHKKGGAKKSAFHFNFNDEEKEGEEEKMKTRTHKEKNTLSNHQMNFRVDRDRKFHFEFDFQSLIESALGEPLNVTENSTPNPGPIERKPSFEETKSYRPNPNSLRHALSYDHHRQQEGSRTKKSTATLPLLVTETPQKSINSSRDIPPTIPKGIFPATQVQDPFVSQQEFVDPSNNLPPEQKHYYTDASRERIFNEIEERDSTSNFIAAEEIESILKDLALDQVIQQSISVEQIVVNPTPLQITLSSSSSSLKSPSKGFTEKDRQQELKARERKENKEEEGKEDEVKDEEEGRQHFSPSQVERAREIVKKNRIELCRQQWESELASVLHQFMEKKARIESMDKKSIDHNLGTFDEYMQNINTKFGHYFADKKLKNLSDSTSSSFLLEVPSIFFSKSRLSSALSSSPSFSNAVAPISMSPSPSAPFISPIETNKNIKACNSVLSHIRNLLRLFAQTGEVMGARNLETAVKILMVIFDQELQIHQNYMHQLENVIIFLNRQKIFSQKQQELWEKSDLAQKFYAAKLLLAEEKIYYQEAMITDLQNELVQYQYTHSSPYIKKCFAEMENGLQQTSEAINLLCTENKKSAKAVLDFAQATAHMKEF